MKTELIIDGVVINHYSPIESVSFEFYSQYMDYHCIITIESEFSLKDTFPDMSNVTFSNKQNKSKSLERCMVIKETYQKFVEGCEPYEVLYETKIMGYYETKIMGY